MTLLCVILFPAHPRWRGEHTTAHDPAAAATGSSPLARGAPGEYVDGETAFRLIPAGAGSTTQTRF